MLNLSQGNCPNIQQVMICEVTNYYIKSLSLDYSTKNILYQNITKKNLQVTNSSWMHNEVPQ